MSFHHTELKALLTSSVTSSSTRRLRRLCACAWWTAFTTYMTGSTVELPAMKPNCLGDKSSVACTDSASLLPISLSSNSQAMSSIQSGRYVGLSLTPFIFNLFPFCITNEFCYLCIIFIELYWNKSERILFNFSNLQDSPQRGGIFRYYGLWMSRQGGNLKNLGQEKHQLRMRSMVDLSSWSRNSVPEFYCSMHGRVVSFFPFLISRLSSRV